MRLLFAIALFTSLLVACGAPAGEPEVVALPVSESPTPEPVIPTPLPTETPEPTETPTPEPLTPSDIFTRLSPSVAYISVPGSSGSGALIDGGYILTNAHVVWPYEAADITFPNGETFEDVPLVARDALRDIALLGPIETNLTPVRFVDSEGAVVGSDILLIGYPGETGRAPQPTLTEGLISRVREWEDGGITFFQTSSAVAGGQSGGIAVTPDGEVIGLSGLRFTEANYGLIASAADMRPFVAELIAGTADAVKDDPPREITSDRFDLSFEESMRAYRVVAPPGSKVEISVEGPGDVNLSAVYPDGAELEYVDKTRSGKEMLRFTMPSRDVPIFAIVSYQGNYFGRFKLTSDQPLIEVFDPDDGMPVNIGDSYTGTIHFPFDNDRLLILLDEGEEVTVRVDTIGFDPLLAIDVGAGADSIIADNDSGGGLFDANPEMTYKASEYGIVGAVVVDLSGAGAGSSYTITVSEPYEGAPTPMAPKPTPTPIAATVGQMRLIDDPVLPFTFEAPFIFGTENNSAVCQRFVEASQPGICITSMPVDMGGLTILAVSEDTKRLGVEEFTLDEYVSILRAAMNADPTSVSVTERSITTADGGSATLLEIEMPDEAVRAVRFVHVYRNREAHSISFIYDPSMKETVDYIISTFRVR